MTSLPAPERSKAQQDIKVVTASATQIQLRKGPDAAQSYDSPAMYALAWDSGTGQVGPATVNAAGTVTRPFKLTSGTSPRAGQGAGLERSYWLGDPAKAMGLEKQDVTIGNLPAWYFPGQAAKPATVAIFVHGQNGTRLDGLRFLDAAHRVGLPVLVISYRNDRGAPADPSGQLQFGRTEWRDLDAAVRWTLDRGAQKVVLAGLSMGGGIVASFLQNSPRRDAVSRVVFDAPMLSLTDVVTYGARDALPGGLAAPASLIWSARQIATMRYGVDWSAIDYLDNTSWLRVPTLLIHGAADPKVPLTVSQQLHAAKPGLVTLAVFPTALHVESWNVDRVRYTSLVKDFLAPLPR